MAVLFLYMCCMLKLLTAGQTTVNLATIQGRTCRQSSTYTSQPQGSSCNAANGNTDGTFSDVNCIHTDTAYSASYSNAGYDRVPYWEVDLGRTFPVSSIKVWGHAAHAYRLYPFTITVDDQFCATVTSNSNNPLRDQTVTCNTVLRGRRVRLTRGYHYNDFTLNLCELQVFVASQCNAGYYGPNCNILCNGYCGGEPGSNLCEQSTGNCFGCVAGFYGDQCTLSCYTNNRCTECSQDGGQCTACSGNFQPPGCSDCLPSYYGAACNQVCPPRCSQACDRNNGCQSCSGNFLAPACTDCMPSYYGAECDQVCPPGCSQACHRNNGCLSCTGNFQAPACTGCKSSYYGAACDQVCPSRCSQLCDRYNGCQSCTGNFQVPACTGCKSSYYGAECDQVCPSRCSQLCDRYNGCQSCTGNFQAPACTGCKSSYYGAACDQVCPSRCSQLCDRYNGCQSCTGNFQAPACTGCKSSYYGAACDQVCPSRCSWCDRNNGCQSCTGNFQAPACTECKGGYYLKQYQGWQQCEQCSTNCNMGCNSSNGTCNGCVRGYFGDRCDQACSSFSTILNNCATCNQTGDCTGCTGNTQFPGCTVCQDGYYRYQPGDTHCTECKWQCGGDTPCDKMTGHCDLCPDGKQGDRCQQACDNNHYGPSRCSLPCGQCEGNAQCDPVNGICPRCQPGRYPPLCQEACRDKTYGQNCTGICGQCQGGQPCNAETGTCTEGCANGWTDLLCKAECSPGFYGARCNSTCGNCQANTTCDHESGTCPQGCAGGYNGDLCMQAASTGGSPPSTVIGAVSGVLVAALVVAAIVAVLLVRRRRRRNDKPADRADSGSAEMTNSMGAVAGKAGDSDSSTPQASANDAGNGVYASVKPRAIVNPTTTKPAVMPKPAQSGASRGAIYENVAMLNSKTSLAPATPPKKPKTGDADMSPTPGGAARKEGKPPVPAKPSKGRESNMNSETVASLEPLPDDDDEEEGGGYSFAEEVTYGNIKPTTFRLNQLQESMTEKLREGTYNDEFGRLNPNKEFSLTNGKMEENHFKNRFLSIVPYDKNRVELDKVDGDDTSDYMNASFIKGFKSKKAYIAAQGPKPNTVDDFWRMVWQEGVTAIVMLTNLKEGGKGKCHEYWPAPTTTLEAGHMEVKAVEEETRAHFVIRTFDLSQAKGYEKRRVQQFHYVSWPDHDVPAVTPLLDFWRYVRARAPRAPSAPPLVVHCSAGVGRTGTYIALDVIIDHVQTATEVNIYNIVDRLRDDRCHMVQNKGQYVFLHEAVLEAYSGRDVRVKVADMDTVLQSDVRHNAPHSRVDAEFKTLCKMRDNQKDPTYTDAKQPENSAKNRNKKTLPNDKNLAYITQHVQGRNQYINAVYLSTFEMQRGCIMTQLPLSDTVVDIWRLVDGSDVNTIVSIGDFDKKQSKAIYWPHKAGSPVKAAPYTITLKSMSKIGDTLCSYTVAMKKNDTARDVRVLHLSGWTGEVADSTDDLVHLLTTLQTIAKDNAGVRPVVVQCIDGASRSGLVCVLSDVISRMTCDQELDVYMAVRQLHAVRPEALISETQYRYCYQVAQHFRNSTNVYANT